MKTKLLVLIQTTVILELHAYKSDWQILAVLTLFRLTLLSLS